MFCFVSAQGDDPNLMRVERASRDEFPVTTEELCKNKDNNEYFRLSFDDDCRDVVR